MVQARYQYDTNPRKIETQKKEKQQQRRKLEIVKDIPRQEIKLSAAQRKKRFKLTVYVVIAFILLLTISYRNSQINEKFNNVQTLKKQLSVLQKENEQLKVTIENGENLNNIEKEAKEKLGMQKLTNKQTVYVNLPKKDYVESPSEKVVIEQNDNWLTKIVNKIFNKK
jgi:cell division protein FtsL